MPTVQHLDGPLLSINIFMIVAHAIFKNVHKLCISNLPCILLFSYLLKKTFHLNVQVFIINRRDWFSNVSLSIV